VHAIIPRRVILECAGDITSLLTSPGVIGAVERPHAEHARAEGTRLWVIQIEEHTNPQVLLQRCFEQGIALTCFDYTQPSLHDVFVHLVGSDAREHVLR